MPQILFVMSDTGGGHRAAARAIIGAIDHLEPGGRFESRMVDFFKETFVPPFNRGGGVYGPLVNKADWLWGLGFSLAKPRLMRRMLNLFGYVVAIRGMGRLLRAMRPDLVVSVHPLATSWVCRLVHRVLPGVAFVTVVTDLATGHPVWYTPCADLTIVPSEAALQDALRAKMRPERVEVAGLPIDLRFASLPDHNEASALKAHFGLPADKPLVLLVGGGEGMGRLEEQAAAVTATGLDVSMMIIAGRNEALRARLAARAWKQPVVVTGFVNDMPERMVAADVILTKAGPGTLSEALAAGLPILVTGFIPGQEEGNVTWVVEGGAGRYTPELPLIQSALSALFPGSRPGELYQKMATAARQLSHPAAALTVARRLIELAERKTNPGG
jgi:1,2-diacylglycerol 3-beta-galactosyltransferase